MVDVVLHRLCDRMPSHATLHVGTTSAAVRVRPLGAEHARLSLEDPSAALPLVAGDRVVLRDPGAHEVLAGATVLDAHPPPLTRRGDAGRRATALAAGSATVHDTATRTGPDGAAGGEADVAGERAASGPLLALLAWLDDHKLEPAPVELVAPVSAADVAAAERAGRLVRLGGLTLPGATLQAAAALHSTLPPRFSAGDADGTPTLRSAGAAPG